MTFTAMIYKMFTVFKKSTSSPHKKLKKRVSIASMDFHRATGAFNKPKHDGKADRSTLSLEKDLLNVPKISDSRNAKSAPSTPDAESRLFPRHSSTGDLEGMKTKKSKGLQHNGLPSGASSLNSSPHMSKRRNQKFHRLFPNIPQDEHVLNYFSCALVGDILTPGSLYVSENWTCYHSKILNHEKQIMIPFTKITCVTRERTAFIIPNAIGIATDNEKYIFGSLLSRDTTYKFLLNLWKKAQYDASIDCKVPSEEEEEESVNGFDESGSNDIEIHDSLECDLSRDNSELDLTLPVCGRCGARKCIHLKQLDLNSPCQTSTPVENESKEINVDSIPISSPFQAFCKLKSKIERLPRTHALLGVCVLLAVFLLFSGAVLAYKILLLQATLDSTRSVWFPHDPEFYRTKLLQDSYYLNRHYHSATVEKLHNVLQANIKMLDGMYMSLKSLQSSPVLQSCAKEDLHKDRIDEDKPEQ